MKLEYCSGCPFSEKRKGKTKPMYHCHYGRYKNDSGFPCSWIKKCEHHEQFVSAKKMNGEIRNVKNE